MKKDNSKGNFNYPGLSIDKIISNPDEYIVPECLEACKKFWDMNIFTASCSNRNEKKDKNGNIRKFIMVSHLSSENAQIFDMLVKTNPKNYCVVPISGTKYYTVVISSKDNIEDRDIDSQKLLELVSPFKMQDCLEGFISIEDYYSKNLDDPSSISDSELIAAVKKHLAAFGKLDLLDLDGRVVYKSKFYKDAHQKYLKMQQPENPDSQEPEL